MKKTTLLVGLMVGILADLAWALSYWLEGVRNWILKDHPEPK